MWTGLQIETRGEVGGGGLVGGTYIRCQCCHFERRKEGTLHHSTAAFPCEWTDKTPKLFTKAKSTIYSLPPTTSLPPSPST